MRGAAAAERERRSALLQLDRVVRGNRASIPVQSETRAGVERVDD